VVDDRETLKAGVVMFVTVSGTIFYQGIIFIQPIFVSCMIHARYYRVLRICDS